MVTDEIAKDITIAFIPKLSLSRTGNDEDDNERLAQEIGKLFKSVYQSIVEA